MRKLGIIVFVLGLIVVILVTFVNRRYPPGIRVSFYHDDINNNRCSFHLGDYEGGLHGGPCGIGEAVNWSYNVFLSGAGNKFAFENVDVQPINLSDERPITGEVLLDRSNQLVTIALKVRRGTNLIDFKGNGTFKINREP